MLGMDWGIWLAADEIRVMADAACGAAPSCCLLCAGLVAADGNWNRHA